MLDAPLKDTRTAGKSERKKEEGGGKGRKRNEMQEENQKQEKLSTACPRQCIGTIWHWKCQQTNLGLFSF